MAQALPGHRLRVQGVVEVVEQGRLILEAQVAQDAQVMQPCLGVLAALVVIRFQIVIQVVPVGKGKILIAVLVVTLLLEEMAAMSILAHSHPQLQYELGLVVEAVADQFF